MDANAPSTSDKKEGQSAQELRQQLAEREAELSVLNSIQSGLLAGEDLDGVFELVGDKLAEIFPGHTVALYLTPAGSGFAEVKYLLEEGERLHIEPVEPGPIGLKAIQLKKPFMISTLQEFKEIGAKTVEGTAPSLSGIYAPLIVRDSVFGAMNIENTQKEHAFSQADFRLVASIANSLSLALENVRLLDELHQSNQTLTESLQQQSAVSGILRVMATMPTAIDPVLQAVVTQAGELCQADDVQVYQVDGDRLRQVAHAGPLPGLDQGETLPLVAGLVTGRAVLERRTIHTHDASKLSPDEYPVSVELQRRLKHRSVIVTPMIHHEHPIGAIVARRNEVKPFTDKQVGLLSTLADQATIAIENVRLFNETDRLLKETEQGAQELAIINSVQAALAAKRDIQAIYDAVGDKLHEVFSDAQVVDILSYDKDKNLFFPRYVVERDQRFEVEPWTVRGFRKHVVETGEPLVINENMEQMVQKYDNDWVVLGEQAKSWLGMPLVVGGEVTGVISLQHIDRENAFSDSDVNLLQTLANSMSVALESARLFDESQWLLKETKRRAAELSIINTVQQALVAEMDIEAIYEAVGMQLRAIFDSQIVTIGYADMAAEMLHYHFGYEKGERLGIDSISFNSLYEDLFKKIAAGQSVVYNGDFPEYAATFEDYQVPQGEMPLSLLAVPIPRAQDSHIVELITLQDVDGDRQFTQSDVRLLETLAGSTGVALENARLFSETQRLLQESEQRAAELKIINSVQRGLASKVDMQGIYQLVGDKIREIFKADTTFITFKDINQGTLVAPYYNDRGKSQGVTSRPYGTGLAEIIIESGKALFFNTAEEMRAAGSYEIPSPGSDKDLNQSFLGVPIFREGEVIGATSVQSYHPFAFTQNDQTLLQTLTNSMGVALENARLFDETQRLLVETEQRATELASINAVGQALVSETELESLIELIGEQVQHTFSADIVYIALVEKESELIRFPYSYGESFDPMPLGQGLTSKILESGKPLLINEEMDKKRDELGVVRVGKKASSYLGVPIKIGAQTFGVVSVQSADEEWRFDESDLHLLSTIAANVGVAIRNASLFDEIKRQKQYYEAVIENSPAAIVLLDMDANVTGWNPAAERLFGYSKEEAIGHNVDTLVANDDELYKQAVSYSKQAMREQEVSQLARRTRKDGSLVEVDLAGVPVSVDGESVGFIAIYHDVTELQQARKEAEQANQAKSTFLANMSHELRTPLNAIIGFTRIVRRKGDGALPQKQLDNLDKVLVSADHLLGLINTVLDISKIEAGRMDVTASEFQLPPLLRQVIDTGQPLVKKGVHLSLVMPESLPTIYSDQEKIKQILINLLSNAAKFTEHGQITLEVRHEIGRLDIYVSDTGIGISKEALEFIFEEFQQADTSTTRQYGGTGLGLSISRSLARLLGGELSATSQEGEGSTFCLTISTNFTHPSSSAKQGSSQPVEHEANSDRPIVLAIDDDPNVHDILRENLGEEGYRVVSARNGKEGLKLARELSPFAITLDIMMPGKDGWQVLHELKSNEKSRDIPVIMLTIVDKESLGYKLGADDFLVKPLDETAVLAALQRLRGDSDDDNRELLVVDDDPATYSLVQQLIESETFSVKAAYDGKQALQQVRRGAPNVMLLDLLIPDLNGFELLEELRSSGYHFPVIVLTAKSLTAAEMAQLEGNVTQVIQKNGLAQDQLLVELRRAIAHLSHRASSYREQAG